MPKPARPLAKVYNDPEDEVNFPYTFLLARKPELLRTKLETEEGVTPDLLAIMLRHMFCCYEELEQRRFNLKYGSKHKETPEEIDRQEKLLDNAICIVVDKARRTGLSSLCGEMFGEEVPLGVFDYAISNLAQLEGMEGKALINTVVDIYCQEEEDEPEIAGPGAEGDYDYDDPMPDMQLPLCKLIMCGTDANDFPQRLRLMLENGAETGSISPFVVMAEALFKCYPENLQHGLAVLAMQIPSSIAALNLAFDMQTPVRDIIEQSMVRQLATARRIPEIFASEVNAMRRLPEMLEAFLQKPGFIESYRASRVSGVDSFAILEIAVETVSAGLQQWLKAGPNGMAKFAAEALHNRGGGDVIEVQGMHQLQHKSRQLHDMVGILAEELVPFKKATAEFRRFCEHGQKRGFAGRVAAATPFPSRH